MRKVTELRGERVDRVSVDVLEGGCVEPGRGGQGDADVCVRAKGHSRFLA